MSPSTPKYAVKDLFGISGLSIAWYGVIIGIGILAGFFVALERAKRDHFPTSHFYDYLLFALPISILCARLYYVIFNWDTYQETPKEIFAIWHGGLAIYGGVIGAIVTAVVFCRIRKLSFLRLADLCIPGLVIGQAIGRWGNFINQEAYGALVTEPHLKFFPYAVYIDRLQEWRQATFFYESLWNVVLFFCLCWLGRRINRQGAMLPLYFIGYGTGRFLIESLRADSLYLCSGIRVSQALSLILIVVGAVTLIWIGRYGKEKSGG